MLFRSFSNLVALSALVVVPACAQAGRSTSGTDCHGVLTATVASGRTHPHLNQCWDQLLPEMVEVITESPRHSEPEYLARVITYVSPYRDPQVAEAALALAGRSSAPASAQMLGWVLAVFQLRPSLYLRSIGNTPQEWLSATRIGRCDWGSPTDAEYFRDHGLAPGYREELSQLAQAVSKDESRPVAARGYARCVLELLATFE